MKRRLLSLLAFTLGLVSSTWALEKDGDVYQIGSAQDLIDFADFVNAGGENISANAVLTNDINMAGKSWNNPIGIWTETSNVGYNGHFDGQGYKIENLEYTTNQNYHGLFGVLLDGAVIENFSIYGTITNVSYDAISVVAYSKNSTSPNYIRNIHSYLNITSSGQDKKVGGILGNGNNGTTYVDRCIFSGTLKSTNKTNCGGIAAYIQNNSSALTHITNCLFDGRIESTADNAYCGGIVGYIGANCAVYTITNCLSIGTFDAPVAGSIFGYVRNGGGGFSNNYYFGSTTSGMTQNTGANNVATSVSEEQLASGEVCYALNGDQSDIAWYQTLPDDDVPTLDNTHEQVYVNGRQHCDGTAYEGMFYSNENLGIVKDEHDFVNGYCTYCNKLDVAYLTPNGEGYYEIGIPAQLKWFADFVNTGGENMSVNAVLTADIDMSELTDWTAIGDWGAIGGTSSACYKGHFDGQGHTINNFTFTSTHNYYGIFGVISTGALIENFSIYGTITLKHKTGGVVGYARDATPTIRNIHSYLVIVNTNGDGNRPGGILGSSVNGTIEVQNCTYSGTIDAQVHTGNYGGIVGYVNNNAAAILNITNCLFDGEILNETAGGECGGIVGYNNAGKVTIKNCLSIGSITSGSTGMFFGALNGNNSVYFGSNFYVGSATQTGGGSAGGTAPVAVTAEQLASGEVCYALNGDQSTIAFYQTLPDDDVPTLDNTHEQVYLNGRQHCDGTAYEGTSYSNENLGIVTDDHEFANGFCTYCNAWDETYMTANDEGVFEIGTGAQLKWFAIYVNTKDVAANAILTDDINLKDIAWTSIGNANVAYEGVFDGQGYKISGFNCASEGGNGGMFAKISSATIKNFSIDGSFTIGGGKYNGVIAQSVNSTINNVHSSLEINVTGGGAVTPSHMGGVVGSTEGGTSSTISNCVFSGSITMATGLTGSVAGVVGYMGADQIINCANFGTITFEATNCNAGGIVAYINNTNASVKNCLNTGIITCNGGSATYGGAIVGRIKNNYSASKILNNYWLEGSATGGAKKDNDTSFSLPSSSTESVTVEQLASGEVAYNLGTAFRQNLGEDATPVLDATHGIVNQITEAGYATQYIEETDVEIPEGVEAYAGVMIDDANLALTPIEGKIAAGEPVVLKGAAGYYSFVPTIGAVKAEANDLMGAAVDTEADGSMYILADVEDKVGFYLAEEGSTIEAGKAYLKKNGNTGPLVKIFFAEEDATAIENVNVNDKLNNGAIYNIAGQRISKLQKGINIVGGKKILF